MLPDAKGSKAEQKRKEKKSLRVEEKRKRRRRNRGRSNGLDGERKVIRQEVLDTACGFRVSRRVCK